MKRTAYTIATLALLAGCASNSATPPTGSTPAPTPAPTATSLQAIADRIGCIGYTDDSASSPLTREYGDCLMDTENMGSVQLYRFGTAEVLPTFWSTVAAFGVAPDSCASAGLIVVCPADPADLPAIAAALR